MKLIKLHKLLYIFYMRKLFSKIMHAFKTHDIKISPVVCVCAVLAIVSILIFAPFNKKEETFKDIDQNVYLDEEICYAGGIYIKANSISVEKNELQNSEFDSDGELLSAYTLKLGLELERRKEDKFLAKTVFKPSSFSLKNVNLEAKSKMAIFIESLAKESFNSLLSISTGSINILEETVNFVGEYTIESIENAQFKTDFKKIKCNTKSFDQLRLDECYKKYYIQLLFPIKQQYLDSKNIIVLSIDHWNHIEKKIFLIKRQLKTLK